jgi:acyl-CoA oxidase
LILDY